MDMLNFKPGTRVDYNGRAYRIIELRPARNSKPWELDYLTMRDVQTNGAYVWETGGHFQGMRAV